MSEIDTKKVEEALDLANHPNYNFSLTKKDSTKVAGETHYNFHGTSVDLTEDIEGEKKVSFQSSYTLIVNEKSGGVYLKHTSPDEDGKVSKETSDKLVGAWSSISEFNKAVDKATQPEIVDGQKMPPMCGTVLEALHNVELAKAAAHGMPTGKGASPEVETGAAR